MNIDFGNININNSLSYATSFGNKISDTILNSIIDKDNDKIGFLISFIFHFSIIVIAIGIPSCFQPTTINVPNIIPIEILDIDELTIIPKDFEKKEDTINKEEIKKNKRS